MSSSSRLGAAYVWSMLTAFGCGGDWENNDAPNPGAGGQGGAGGQTGFAGQIEPPAALSGLHAVGNQIQNDAGEPVVLRGVNRSGTEYQCIQFTGIFDGPSDEASVQAMKTWNINAVRVPLNEACWLGISGAPEAASGDVYKTAIRDYVALLHKYEIVPILDLHWAAPGTTPPRELLPMPNVDHTADFWRDVATTFKDDRGVVFEPYNEPFPDRNRDSDAAWQCWRDGCTTTHWDDTSYQAAGMQAMVDAIRETGADQLILLGGVQYSNALTQWLTYKPQDPLNNLGAAWHVYNFNACVDESCWNTAPGAVGADFPIVATEIGQNDCQGTFITPLMQWLDARGFGYLAWSWNVIGTCQPAPDGSEGGNPWPLIRSYVEAEPNGAYAETFRSHLVGSAP